MTLYILTAEQLKRTMELLPEDEDLPEVDEPTAAVEGELDHMPAVEAAVIHSLYGDAAAMTDQQFEAFMLSCGMRKRILPT